GEFPGDGGHPLAGLLSAKGGLLYGTKTDNSYDGGPGPLFRVRAAWNKYRGVDTFGSINNDGQKPNAAPIAGTDGFLYGSTRDGGSSGYGTVFMLKKDGTSYSILHNFSTTADEGQNPGQLLEASDGRLYGTTFYGGKNGSSTVFRLNKDGSGY